MLSYFHLFSHSIHTIIQHTFQNEIYELILAVCASVADKGKKRAERDDEEEELWKTQPGVSLCSLILNLKKFLLFIPFIYFYDSKYTLKSRDAEENERREEKEKTFRKNFANKFFLPLFCVFQHFLHKIHFENVNWKNL